MSNASNKLLKNLRSLLKYHQLIGINQYPRNDGIASFLRIDARHGGSASGQQKAVNAGPDAPKIDRPAAIVPPAVNLAEINAEIITCEACGLHKERIYPVPGHGPDKVRLVIVGDWLSADAAGNLPPDHLFGVLQDEMLSKMLVAINLSADEVFVTNVIKCAVPAKCQPQATHVQTCASFLRRQIMTLSPEMICVMGITAARVVLEIGQPLSRLRGRFHSYTVDDNATIPVIATYHPTYLLQNPEMKRATWADLQMMAKKMGLL